jgi:4a-hydroxytetrahydrobiopterin dehydratase
MGTPLAEQHCRPLPKGTPPLAGPELEPLFAELDRGWRVASGPMLVRRFASRDYARLVSLAAQIGALAEEQDHHPGMELAWGRLDVALSTHSIGGLSQNDFVLAARIDRLALAT